jgi:hypothetical protein
MSTPVTLQGNVLSISLCPTGTNTFKKVLCQSDFSLKNNLPTSTTQTNCGALVAIGIPQFSGSFNAVFDSNTNPSIEISLNQLEAWISPIPTLLDLQIEYATTGGSIGSTYFRQGQVYISDITETASTAEFLKMAVTFTGNGYLTATGW